MALEQYRVLLARELRRDFAGIRDYLLGRGESIDVVEHVHAGILGVIDSLAYLPRRNPRHREAPDGRTYHRTFKWSYVIAYEVVDDPPRVRVYAVIDGRRDPAAVEAVLGARE